MIELDQQLIVGGKDSGERGFPIEVHEVEQSLAERHGQRIVLARNLLATLRERDVGAAGLRIAKETGLAHRLVVDGERVSGVYPRDVLLHKGYFVSRARCLPIRFVHPGY